VEELAAVVEEVDVEAVEEEVVVVEEVEEVALVEQAAEAVEDVEEEVVMEEEEEVEEVEEVLCEAAGLGRRNKDSEEKGTLPFDTSRRFDLLFASHPQTFHGRIILLLSLLF